MCVLVAEYLGGGLSEFWACDQRSEDLIPFGSCKCGVMVRKPEQNDDERNDVKQDGFSRLAG